MKKPEIPLVGPPPEEVPLAAPPLVRVLAQVRYPMIVSVEKRDFIAPFQEAIRREYPILREEPSVLLDLEGLEKRTSTTCVFQSLDSDWRATLTSEFLTLETTLYTSRIDFLNRLRRVLEPLEAHIGPALVDRIGVRFVDRIEGESLNDLPTLVRPELSGILATPLRDHVRHWISESLLELPDEEAQVKARWGLLPSRATVEPAVIEQREAPTWILDLDAFRFFGPTPERFDVDQIVGTSQKLAERIYSIFRWAVTDELLRRYGGTR